MSEKKVHQPLPLDSLFVFLEAHGFRTDPARRFRLLRVLYSRGWSELGEDGFQTLKYRLAPFVITSADEQERFYALFDQWLAEAEQEAAPMQDDEVEQPVAPAGSQPRRFFLPAMLGTGIVMAFLAVYFFGSPPLPRIQERMANLVEGTPVSFSMSLDWRQSPKHLGWRLIGASTDTLLAGQPAFSFVTPVGAGDTLQLVLMYRGAVTDSLFLPVYCATPPEIKGLSLPAAIVANQEFSLGVSLDSGLMAQWVLGVGDTTLFGARVTYTPATSDNLSVQLRVYQPDGYDCCFSETRQLLRAETAEKPYMAKAPLQRDAPLLSRSLHGLFWLLPLILLGLALAGLQHRQKKRRAYRIGSQEEEVEFEIKDNAPYFIPYLPHDDLIQVPREFYQMVEVLRRREMGTTRNFDLGASLQATLESGGYPAFKEKWNTRPGSWLFLIERKTPREQLGRLFGRLAGFLTAENAPVDIYVHDGSFNNFLPYGGAPSAKPLNLYELYQRYPLHRLVALGSGRGMINTYQGLIFPGIRKGLERWDKRLLLTPLPVSDWSGEESLLHDLFVMYPADTAGCLAGFEQMDSQEDDYEPGDFKVWRGLLFRERSDERLTDLYFEDPADYRFYLGYNKDLYRWLCGLSVCVAPDWSLTLAIGHALGVEITHDNLLKLARIPWLNENAPDTGMRLKLLSQLSEEDVQKARGALLEELDAVKDAVKGGFAEVEQRSQHAVQQFALDPRDSGHREHLRALMRAGWISGGQKVELEEVVWKNADKEGLKGVARDSLQAYLDAPAELPSMRERLIAPILLAVLAVVLVFHGLWGWPAWSKAPWWVTQEEMDEAFVVHKEALDLADSLDLADAGSIDTLFGRAVQLRRPDYYAAADANRQAFRFNQGVRALHAILDQNTLVNGLDSQALVWFGQAETGPDPQLSLAALHGLGLTYFYQSDTSLARRVYQELMAATGQTYFDSLSLTQPVHLAYLLGKNRDFATTPEADFWAASLRLNSVRGFWSYLEKYPSGQYVAEARNRLLGLEDAYWREVKDRDRITDYQQYVRYYANGKYVAEARARLTKLRAPLVNPEPETLDVDIGKSAVADSPFVPLINTPIEEIVNPIAPVIAQKPSLDPIISNLERNMVAISGGTFMMGCTAEQGQGCYDDERPVHEVTLSGYYLGKYEVTQAEWRAVMGADPEELAFPGCDQCPVERVNWDDVQEFIKKLNSLTGKRYRLPTEAEWEYAARGGKNARGYKYAGSNNMDEVGWYDGNSGEKTHPVGQKRSNELGLYDMSGNVREWCSDWYGDYNESSETNPRGPSTGNYRVFRGGSWGSFARHCRVSFRIDNDPTFRNNDALGFRLARSSS